MSLQASAAGGRAPSWTRMPPPSPAGLLHRPCCFSEHPRLSLAAHSRPANCVFRWPGGSARSGGGRGRGRGLEAARSSLGADRLGGGGATPDEESHSRAEKEPSARPDEDKGVPLAVAAVPAAVVGVGALAALALSGGDPAALLAAVSKSGFPAAFALIFVSEIGDKTFFIAALMAMRYSKWAVLVGASAALAVMTVISVAIGKLCQRVPAQLQTTLPVGEYAAVALLVWFGLRSIKAAWDAPTRDSSGGGGEGELAEAEEFLKKADHRRERSGLEVVGEAFTLIFVAEWGDRSMLATIALGAAQSALGVASGAIAGHVLATALAVVGGALLSRYLSEKVIGYAGGVLFLAFAAATLAGVF